ncbi:tripartite tricarboxylate transporter substrate binding protein [Xylophilus sp. GOD-11R]|uniref:Bug family tripartite tricarboxylate transporter substrate binding protein n=1 Tax=Xylophilus sp. GOD-11R TaxID=3089814 RepID=UPI00298C215C|nr:tripartite tricarboxylate transporter substrate binding protein [Xylophilus sp. GOD-11R]WPB58441.1 tripartite tricarboxylate transporter substrate binding protein [Xylophilus sp. GOD-11R]
MNQTTAARRRSTLAAALALAALSVAGPLAAQPAYPSKPIRLVVPFPPGGGTDLIARTVAQKLTETLKWTIVIDNRPGAGGNLGVDQVAKSPADGYTLVMGQTSNLAINPTLYTKLPYDPLKDLTPVVLVANSPIVVAVPENSRFKTFAEVVAAAKGKPKTLTLGYPGNGTVAHLAGEQAENTAGIELQHVPYKGAAQALTDLMSGQIDLYASSVPTLIGQVRNQKVRALVVTSAKRSEQLPDTPTMAESGYKGFEAVTWFGILAPAGTPAAIVKTLNTEINKAMQVPEVAAKLKSDGGDVMGGSVETFAALLKSEIPRWGKIVKDSGATID